MTETFPYKSANAFRSALDAHIKNASTSSRSTTNELRRQFAYGRFLARVFSTNPNQWILKGGGALLARHPTIARHSLDIDLYHANSIASAMSELQKIGADDTHPDYFTFDVSKGRQIGQGTRSKVIAYLGPTIYERFGIDIVVGTNMTQTPETIAPIEPIHIPGINSPNYLGYPSVDHIADKHAAMLETHNGEPSSRYRDLYDLVVFATTAQIDAGPLCKALLSEYEHRGLKPPTEIQLPSPKWIAGYESLDKPSSITEQTTDQAVTLISKFLEPVLNGLTIGTWNPASQSWETD